MMIEELYKLPVFSHGQATLKLAVLVGLSLRSIILIPSGF